MILATLLHYARYLEVDAMPRYLDDASIDGRSDPEEGDPRPPAMPFLEVIDNDYHWRPVIDLDAGVVLDWPEGVTADIHYKVCDQGEYWLQSADRKRIAKWMSDYVPTEFLCMGDDVAGFGDYIILKIDGTGSIYGWRSPFMNVEQWEAVEDDGA